MTRPNLHDKQRGAWLESILKSRDMRLEDFGKAYGGGAGRQTVARWLAGQFPRRASHLRALCKNFGVSPEVLRDGPWPALTPVYGEGDQQRGSDGLSATSGPLLDELSPLGVKAPDAQTRKVFMAAARSMLHASQETYKFNWRTTGATERRTFMLALAESMESFADTLAEQPGLERIAIELYREAKKLRTFGREESVKT